MKKLFDYRVKNFIAECIVCLALLKMNLTIKKGPKALCYKCWCEANNKNPRARKENKLNGKRRMDKAN